MHHIIFGKIEFVHDEEWNKEALIHEHHFSVFCLEAEEAKDIAEDMVKESDYIIYELYEGRIYNMTDYPVEITDSLVLAPRSKMEVKHGREQVDDMG